ncbi:MAG TPA: PspC domain-containing protein [Propionibacteriaceae bacterium]|nr:PspC domain-containing protein [Propionibacteriaceae bacterium]
MSSVWMIRRSATDAKVAGLCSGLALHWGIDPVLVRVGWVLLALSGGIGLVLYLAGWLLIPVEGSDKAPVDDFFGESVRRWPRELWITLIVVASLGMFAVFGWLSPFSIGPAIVIAVIWYFGFYKGRQDKRPAAAVPPPSTADSDSDSDSPQPVLPEFAQYSGPATPFTQAAEAWQRRIEEHTQQVAAATQPSATPHAEWPSPPPENLSQVPADSPIAAHDAFLAEPDPAGLYVEPAPAVPVKMSQTRSAKRLRLVCLIVLGLTLSGLGIAQAAGVAIPLAGYLAAALLVIGLTLVAATWFGMARGLLPVGVLLAIAVVTITAAGPAIRVPVAATSTHAYTSLAELPAGDSTDVGTLSVDLSRLAVTSDVTYAAHVDLGQLVVKVPEDTTVLINYKADLGAVRAYGAEVKAGSDLAGDVTDPQPARPGQHTLTLNLSVDAGNIEVQR